MPLSLLRHLARVLIALPAWAVAQDSELPPPAIPGLRYYYPPEKVDPRVLETDVCVYGGTSGGVVAAVQATRMGKSAAVLEFGDHLGGLSSGGLSHTDGGGQDVCGGIAREFYNLIGQANFRPSEAEAAFDQLLEGTGVQVFKRCHLDKVEKEGARIVSITMENGLTVRAKQFIDATYEGDLLARAGVSWHAGREANSVYDETYNGIREPGKGGHNFPVAIDPYVVAGDPSSGLLPRVNDDPGVPGEGDERIQAFCYRMRLTKDDPLPFPKPQSYKPEDYELLARLFESGADPRIRWSIDTNNHHLFNGAYFIDFVGGNYGWPDGSWKEREQLFQDHANYQIGVMWFLTNDPRIPAKWQEEMRRWGLPKDEYEATGGWTHQLYIREGRRMVSDYVMTQANCQGVEVPEDSVGLASYNMDSHHCQMTVVDGAVRNEGNVEIRVNPYPIAYRSLTPKRAECENLLVPVALSSSHIAFGSIRMEPVFMLLGQSAATASVMAIDGELAVQDVPYAQLRERLLADGQILDYTGPIRTLGGKTLDAKSLKGVVIDNEAAQISGPWSENNVTSPRVGETYLHDNNEAKGECIAVYEAKLPKPGTYEVRLTWPPNANRATNVPVEIEFGAGETKSVTVDQKAGSKEGFNSLGVFAFEGSAKVTISNADTNGYVIADAVQFLPAEKPEPKPQVEVKPVGPDAPNFLLILADDLGYEALGCYGSEEFATPHLDELASEGMRFTRAYTSPVCTPSRMSLYTGTYASRHQYYEVLPVHLGTKKAVDFENRWPTYAQVLRSAGYATSVTGKWQLATLEFHPDHIRDAGFDSWCVWQIWKEGAKTTRYWEPCLNHDGKIREDIVERFGPDVLADYVIDQMKSAVAAKQPFCIHHNMMLPHVPIVPTPEEKARGESGSLGGMITYMDSIVGRLTEALDELGIADNTYIIFLGDNGTDVSEPRKTTAGLVTGGKRTLDDGGTHIPMIVRCPSKVSAGEIATDLVDMADWFPTLCELAGIELPETLKLDGVSLASRFTKGSPSPRQFVTGGYHQKITIFDGEWRLSSTGAWIDARNLPQEDSKGPEEGSPEATKLETVMKELTES